MFKLINSCDGIYKNSLDVRFTKVCDNNCSFCIEHSGIAAKEQNIDKMIQSTIDSGKTDILILGGEPLLNIINLKKYIDGIKRHVNNIYITTSLPHSILENWDEFVYIMNNITCLNISLQHYDWKINNEVLRANNNYNRIDLIGKICQDFANKVRVSINLVKGYIDDREKLFTFLETMINLNVKHVKINELQHNADLYVSFNDIYYLPLKEPYVYGCQQEIDLELPIKLTLKRACFCVQPEHIAATEEEIKKYLQRITPRLGYTVLYEDGTLSEGWIVKK